MKNLKAYKRAADLYKPDHYRLALYFRNMALAVHQDPDIIMEHVHHPMMKDLLLDQDSTCVSRTAVFESLAYGDPGVLLACPGPSLAGLIMRELGNTEQKDYFFKQVVNRQARTCLAVTEPAHGSDANHMQTFLSRCAQGSYQLSGSKWLVGHGASAEIGVLIARRNQGPLGVCAVLLTPELLRDRSVERLKLPMTALRGAQLSYLNFQQTPIEEAWVLGKELGALRAGMAALIKTFNRMRPSVAALAIGLSQAVLDYLFDHPALLKWAPVSLLNQFVLDLNCARSLLYVSAKAVDEDPGESAAPSLAKLEATRLSEKIVRSLSLLLPQGALLEHPLLLKWQMDAFGFEYMEGTSNMQRANIFQPYLLGRSIHY